MEDKNYYPCLLGRTSVFNGGDRLLSACFECNDEALVFNMMCLLMCLFILACYKEESISRSFSLSFCILLFIPFIFSFS